MPFELELDGIFTEELTTPASVGAVPIPSGVIPRIGSEYQLIGSGAGREISHDGPYAMAISSEVRAINGIQEGDNGSTLNVGSEQYTILEIVHGRNGIAYIKMDGPL